MTPAWSVSERRPGRPARGGVLVPSLVLATALVAVGLLLALSLEQRLLAWDLRFAYLPAAEAVLRGESPYPAPDDPILEEQKGYVYLPQLALVLVPFASVPVDLLASLAALALLFAVGLTLHVLGVRDLLCYAVALLWMPVASGVLHANLSIPLALGLALAWRYRERTSPSAIALGLAISGKLVLWPMLVWTVATGRLRMTAWAVAVGTGVTLAAWAAIGFVGLAEHPRLLARLAEIQAARSYSLVGIASALGLGETVGRAAVLLGGVALLTACVRSGRRGDDLRSFACAVAATLALSPIVWMHYLVLLLVPLAIARPRFSWPWLLPVILWLSPRPGHADGYETFLPGLVAAALVGIVLLRTHAGRPLVARA